MRCSKMAPISDVVIKSFGSTIFALIVKNIHLLQIISINVPNDQWAKINMLKFGVELALCENGLGQADEGKGKAAVSQLTAAS
ncbi:hypothetical protein T4D_8594 [Trichinella pseudospiralis]|uniref:Uncharacterized protein n=1 Tax=Trichinella pseudospiralis TaxID=6337 RepID=A0A0V1FTG4_TRIPS|nr:hypothetical protein T4D_8594 [Trichinella pseudospiralis]